MPTSSTLIRVTLAWSLFFSPLAATKAAGPARATDYLTRNSVAAVTLRVAETANTEIVQALPVEVADAALQKYLGVPLAAIDRITVVAEPPAGMNPLYAVVVNTTQPAQLEKLPPELTEHTVPGELEGRTLLESQHPMLPSIALFDDTTIAVGPKVFLKRLLKQDPAAESKLARAMNAKGGAENHLHAALMLEPLRGLLQLGMSEAMKEAPPETHKYFGAVDLIGGAILTADLTFHRDSSLTVYANDESDGERLNALLEEGIAELRQVLMQSPGYLELSSSDDPVQRAMASYMVRSSEMQITNYKPRRVGSKAFVLGEIPGGEGPGTMAAIAVTGILIGLLLPAVQAAREAARRNQSSNNMKELMLAILNYELTHKRLPPHAIYSEDGTPLLSWRVAVLPFIDGQQTLYERFKLDEPWNSPNNLPLLAEMPDLFIDPSSQLEAIAGKTHYLAVKGPNSFMTGDSEGTRMTQFTDGTSRTVALIQVDDNHAVEWTKPADYDMVANSANPLAAIGSLHPGIFLTAFIDGHIQNVPLSTDSTRLNAAFTRNGGETVDLP